MPESDEYPIRVFVAVDISADVRHGLVAVFKDAFPRGLPGRSVVPENWHVTLRFVGKVAETDLERLVGGLDQAHLGAPFRLGFGGLGAFPRTSKAAVLWVGITTGAAELEALAAEVESVCADVGFMPEERPFHPHLTVARIRPPVDVEAAVVAMPTPRLRQIVDSIVVYRSHWQRGPARYEELARFPLV